MRGWHRRNKQTRRRVASHTILISSRNKRKHRSKWLMYPNKHRSRSHKHLRSSQPQQKSKACHFSEASELIKETFNCEEV